MGAAGRSDPMKTKYMRRREHGQELVLKLRLREAAAGQGALRRDQSMQPPSRTRREHAVKRQHQASERWRRGGGRALRGDADAAEATAGCCWSRCSCLPSQGARASEERERLRGSEAPSRSAPACLDDFIKHAGQLVKLTAEQSRLREPLATCSILKHLVM